MQGHLTQLYSQGHGVSSNSSNHGVWGRLKGHLTGPASQRTELRSPHTDLMGSENHLTYSVHAGMRSPHRTPHTPCSQGHGITSQGTAHRDSHLTALQTGSWDHRITSVFLIRSEVNSLDTFYTLLQWEQIAGSPHIGPQGHFTGQLNQPVLELCQAHHPAQVPISTCSPSGLGYLQC